MAHKVWTLTLEDGGHTVELDHDTATGDRTLRLDGRVVEQTAGLDPVWAGLGSKHRLQIGGHAAQATIRIHGADYEYLLEVDGRPVAEGVPVIIAEPVASQSAPAATQAVIPIFGGPEGEVVQARAMMVKEIRRWGYAGLGLGAIHLAAAGHLSASWGIILILSGAASFVFLDAAMFVVYGATMAWVTLANLASRSAGWSVLGLLQAYWAFRVFQRFRHFRRVQGEYTALVAAGKIQDAAAGRAGRVFPWLGCLLGIVALGGIWVLVVALVLLAGDTVPTVFVLLGNLVFDIGVLGLAVSLASLLSGFRRRFLAVVGSIANAMVVLAYAALVLLA